MLRTLVRLVAAAALLVPSATGQSADAARRVLRAAGIQPTADGITGFLTGDGTGSDRFRELRVDALIARLDDPRYEVRERASLGLFALGPQVKPRLRRATRTGSLEVQKRAAALLASIGDDTDPLFAAAIAVVREDRIRAALGPLVESAARCSDPGLYEELTATVCALATLADIDVLIAGLDAPRTTSRYVALRALVGILPDTEFGALRPLLDSPEPAIRFEAARAFASRGFRVAVPPLVSLLSATSLEMRQASHALLVDLTGTRLGFSPDGDVRARSRGLVRWRSWLRDQPGAFSWPEAQVARASEAPSPYWLATADALLRCDVGGRVIRRVPRAGVTAVGFSDDRALLVADRERGIAARLDLDGTVVSRVVGLQAPMHVAPVEGGGLLISETAAGRVVERDASGSLVWSAEGLDRPSHALRLAAGNTLITESGSGRIVEITPDGAVTWSVVAGARPRGAARLRSGDTVVSSMDGVVVALSRDGEVRWRRTLGGALEAPVPVANRIHVPMPESSLVAILSCSGEVRSVRRVARPFQAMAYEP